MQTRIALLIMGNTKIVKPLFPNCAYMYKSMAMHLNWNFWICNSVVKLKQACWSCYFPTVHAILLTKNLSMLSPKWSGHIGI